MGEVELLLLGVGEELVQGRVEEADGDGATTHGLEETVKVLALEGQEFTEGGAAFFFVAREDHLAHEVNAVTFEEHVFGAAKPDTDGAVCDGWAVCSGVSALVRTPSLRYLSAHFMTCSYSL